MASLFSSTARALTAPDPPTTLTPLASLGIPSSPPTCISFDPSQDLLTLGFQNASLLLLSQDGREAHIPPPPSFTPQHGNSLRSLKNLVGTKYLVGLFGTSTLLVWDLETLEPATVLEGAVEVGDSIEEMEMLGAGTAGMCIVRLGRGGWMLVDVLSTRCWTPVRNLFKELSFEDLGKGGVFVSASDDPCLQQLVVLGGGEWGVVWDLERGGVQARFGPLTPSLCLVEGKKEKHGRKKSNTVEGEIGTGKDEQVLRMLDARWERDGRVVSLHQSHGESGGGVLAVWGPKSKQEAGSGGGLLGFIKIGKGKERESSAEEMHQLSLLLSVPFEGLGEGEATLKVWDGGVLCVSTDGKVVAFTKDSEGSLQPTSYFEIPKDIVTSELITHPEPSLLLLDSHSKLHLYSTCISNPKLEFVQTPWPSTLFTSFGPTLGSTSIHLPSNTITQLRQTLQHLPLQKPPPWVQPKEENEQSDFESVGNCLVRVVLHATRVLSFWMVSETGRVAILGTQDLEPLFQTLGDPHLLDAGEERVGGGVWVWEEEEGEEGWGVCVGLGGVGVVLRWWGVGDVRGFVEFEKMEATKKNEEVDELPPAPPPKSEDEHQSEVPNETDVEALLDSIDATLDSLHQDTETLKTLHTALSHLPPPPSSNNPKTFKPPPPFTQTRRGPTQTLDPTYRDFTQPGWKLWTPSVVAPSPLTGLLFSAKLGALFAKTEGGEMVVYDVVKGGGAVVYIDTFRPSLGGCLKVGVGVEVWEVWVGVGGAGFYEVKKEEEEEGEGGVRVKRLEGMSGSFVGLKDYEVLDSDGRVVKFGREGMLKLGGERYVVVVQEEAVDVYLSESGGKRRYKCASLRSETIFNNNNNNNNNSSLPTTLLSNLFRTPSSTPPPNPHQTISAARILTPITTDPSVCILNSPSGKATLLSLPTLTPTHTFHVPHLPNNPPTAKTQLDIHPNGTLLVSSAESFHLFNVLHDINTPKIRKKRGVYNLLAQNKWRRQRGLPISGAVIAKSGWMDVLKGGPRKREKEGEGGDGRGQLGLGAEGEGRKGDVFGDTRNKLDERGERLQNLETKFGDLAERSAGFLSAVQAYNKKQEAKKCRTVQTVTEPTTTVKDAPTVKDVPTVKDAPTKKIHDSMSMINKSVRNWTWDSIAYKADFLVKRHGGALGGISTLIFQGAFRFRDGTSLVKHLITQYPEMIDKGRKVDYTWLPLYERIVLDCGIKMVDKLEFVKYFNMGYSPTSMHSYTTMVAYAMAHGSLNLIVELLRLGDITNMSPENVRKAILQKVRLGFSCYRPAIENEYKNLEFLMDEKAVEVNYRSAAFAGAVSYGFKDFAKRLLETEGFFVCRKHVWQTVNFSRLVCVETMVELGFDVKSQPYPLELVCAYPWSMDIDDDDDDDDDDDEDDDYDKDALQNRLIYVNVEDYVADKKSSNVKKLMAESEPEAFAALQFLVKEGCPPTPLALAHAAIMGWEDVVKLLLNGGATITSEAIHGAAFTGHLKIMRQLIQKATTRHQQMQGKFGKATPFKLNPISDEFEVPFIPEMPLPKYLTVMQQLIDIGIYEADHFWSEVLGSALFFNSSIGTLTKLCEAGAKVSVETLEDVCDFSDIQTFKFLSKKLTTPLTDDNRGGILIAASKSLKKGICNLMLQDINTPVDIEAIAGLSFVWVPKSVGAIGSKKYKAAAAQNMRLFEKAMDRFEHSWSDDEADTCLEMYLEQDPDAEEQDREYHEDLDLLTQVVTRLIDEGFHVSSDIIEEFEARDWWDVIDECGLHRDDYDYDDDDLDELSMIYFGGYGYHGEEEDEDEDDDDEYDDEEDDYDDEYDDDDDERVAYDDVD
ncbi:hypothetical protein HDV05_002265 [Chytridiales sp. JEL 0842]|nr:hypothetical protein HDV05_002265 [Chytridiales sp. JEL 0842]